MYRLNCNAKTEHASCEINCALASNSMENIPQVRKHCLYFNPQFVYILSHLIFRISFFALSPGDNWVMHLMKLTVCACASLKSPFSIARIISHLAISIGRCDFIFPSSSSNMTSVNALDPMNFSMFFLTSCEWKVSHSIGFNRRWVLVLPISNYECFHSVLPVAVSTWQSLCSSMEFLALQRLVEFPKRERPNGHIINDVWLAISKSGHCCHFYAADAVDLTLRRVALHNFTNVY